MAYGRSLSEFDLVKYRICSIATKIYVLEAAAYMTAGLIDVQKNPNTFMEANITKLLATSTAK